jgi:FtsK/SpoIIIE family
MQANNNNEQHDWKHTFIMALGVALVLVILMVAAWGISLTLPVFKWVFMAVMVSSGATLTLAIPGVALGYGIREWKTGRHGWRLLRPSKNGNYAQPFQVQTGQLVRVEPANYPALPESFTYHNSPHMSIKEEPRDEVQSDIAQLERVAPRLDDFYEAVPYNSLQTGLGAKLSDGELVTAGIPESVHYKIVGSSGFGKSCLAAGMLDIATTRNSPDVLRIGLLDLSWKTGKLFEHLPHVYELRNNGRIIRMIGRDADEVAQRLGNLKQELKRRAAGAINTPVLLIFIEEMLSLQYEVDERLKAQMLADLNILVLRGRQYGMYFLSVMQADYSTTALREAKAQFRTRCGFAIDSSTARASGFMNTDLVKQNFQRGRPGQYLLEKPAFSELLLAPRYDVESKIASKVTSNPTSNPTSSTPFFDTVDATVDVVTTPLTEPVDATSQNGLSTRSIKVLEMLRQQCGQNEIIKEIWNAKSTDGRPYREAVEEYRKIVAQLVEQK